MVGRNQCPHCGAQDGQKHAPDCPAIERGSVTLTSPEQASKAIQWLEEAGEMCERLAKENPWLVLTTQLTSRGVYMVGRRIIKPGVHGVQIKAETEVTWRGIEKARANVVSMSVHEIVQVLRRASPDDTPEDLDQYDA